MPWSARLADSMLRCHPVSAMRWRYEDGFLVRAVGEVGARTGESRYRQAVAEYVDRFIGSNGSIATYRLADFNLDQILPGRLLFGAYRASGAEKYRQAIELLREQLRRQPRTTAGGFWHKLIYPDQMWLDGVYMGSPFYAQYAAEFDEPTGFDDVVQQIVLIDQHTRDPRTGLLYHAWDASRRQRWADPATGRSPHFWGRAIGWYVMALVDVLEYLPAGHPQRGTLVTTLERTLAAVLTAQDPVTGLWYQVLDQSDRPGNYLEASCASMFVYALAKGARMGYVPRQWLEKARSCFEHIVTRFVEVDEQGEVSLHGICGVAGLGGDPYRDGSFEYYASERAVTNDPKGAAALILAAVEVESD